MSFRSWCLCHAMDAAVRWRALEQAILRRRMIREWEAERARLWAAVEKGLSPGIARDIREWRTEP